jgi:hypothetical protein
MAAEATVSGCRVTDIAIIIVAADDVVQPHTGKAVSHAQVGQGFSKPKHQPHNYGTCLCSFIFWRNGCVSHMQLSL